MCTVLFIFINSVEFNAKFLCPCRFCCIESMCVCVFALESMFIALFVRLIALLFYWPNWLSLKTVRDSRTHRQKMKHFGKYAWNCATLRALSGILIEREMKRAKQTQRSSSSEQRMIRFRGKFHECRTNGMELCVCIFVWARARLRTRTHCPFMYRKLSVR